MRIPMLATAAALALTAAAAPAAPAPEDPAKQTSWGLYLTAKEAYEMETSRPDEVLFVDVREPVEIMFTGFTDVVDVNVPFLLVDPARMHDSKPVLAMQRNPDFADQVLAALEAEGLDRSAPIILMCRSGGSRGAPSAATLEGLGLEQVHVVVDGFEGGTASDDPDGPHRVVDGWKNSGLPWGYAINPDKIHLRSFD
jgi:rhodanese-related sulfurtransferase